MKCKQCGGSCKKDGKQPNGRQKFKCRTCGKCQQASYRYTAFRASFDQSIIAHVKEGCGIWNTARLMGIAKGTVMLGTTIAPDPSGGFSALILSTQVGSGPKSGTFTLAKMYFSENSDRSISPLKIDTLEEALDDNRTKYEIEGFGTVDERGITGTQAENYLQTNVYGDVEPTPMTPNRSSQSNPTVEQFTRQKIQ